MQDCAPHDIHSAEAELCRVLRDLAPVYVAFSAGVDSTYLLAVAHRELGDQVTAVTADSPSLARRSLHEAGDFCRRRGIAHQVVATDEFERQAYIANEGQRCYECKAALFRAMNGLAAATQFDRGGEVSLLLGAVSDDFADVRPGLRAAAEAGARWPLVDAGFSKAMVRSASRALGLATWDRPAEPCLSSRFPYGEPVTRSGLHMIEEAENLLKAQGLSDCRARHHRVGDGRGSLCRIEVPEGELAQVLACRDHLLPAIKALGYQFVSLDLQGLQSGGMNTLLTAHERAPQP